MRTLAVVTLLLSAAVSRAAADPVTKCREAHHADPAAHIRCLEQALRSRDDGPPPVSPADQLPGGATPSPKAPHAAAAGTAAAPSLTVAPAGLGAEQALARQRAPAPSPAEAASVLVVAAQYNAAGLGTFTLADGQVWQETERAPEGLRLKPGREYAARMERGKLGGYRLYVDGLNWMHKVSRLE